MVREAIANALPRPRKKIEQRRGKLTAYMPLIDRMLEEDRRAPRKQRHTAHRIWERLRAEVPGFDVCERSVRKYVERRKQELGLVAREICVPQSYEWGGEAQVDWYEAWADLAGERVKLQVFSMRSMASGGAFHRAYFRATQQAFLEAHELAFQYFGGVFSRVRYDNLTSAVKRIVRGSRREETARFVAFRSHWRFGSEFCTPAEAHEKGGVEGEAGYFRRNHWVPVPSAPDLEQLNKDLLRACCEDQKRQIAGKPLYIGAAMVVERDHLLPFAEPGFDLAEVSFPMVDGLGCVRVNERLLGPAEGGRSGSGEGVFDLRRDLARRSMRRPSRTLLQPTATDPGPGTLLRCAGEEAGCAGRLEAAGAAAPGGTMAGQL